MSDLITDLQSLSDEELAKVGNLIQKFVKRKGDAGKNKEGRSPKPQKQSRQGPKNTVVGPSKGNGRSQPRNPQNSQETPNRRGQSGRKKKSKTCRTEQVQLSGENIFEKMKESRSCKQDSQIDKKLNPNPVPRHSPDNIINKVEVQCRECLLWYDVNPAFVYYDPEEGSMYTCDNCTRKR